MTDIDDHAARLLKKLNSAGAMLATAESCTGGLIAAALTEIAGSSSVFDRGFVTYSNEAKNEMLDVPMALITTHGAVSPHVAKAMAEGALAASKADVTISVTGVAGPGGGSVEKPVGTVHFGCAQTGKPTIHSHQLFAGSRAQIRQQAVIFAFELIERNV